jgi:hypothetical protein
MGILQEIQSTLLSTQPQVEAFRRSQTEANVISIEQVPTAPMATTQPPPTYSSHDVFVMIFAVYTLLRTLWNLVEMRWAGSKATKTIVEDAAATARVAPASPTTAKVSPVDPVTDDDAHSAASSVSSGGPTNASSPKLSSSPPFVLVSPDFVAKATRPAVAHVTAPYDAPMLRTVVVPPTPAVAFSPISITATPAPMLEHCEDVMEVDEVPPSSSSKRKRGLSPKNDTSPQRKRVFKARTFSAST